MVNFRQKVYFWQGAIAASILLFPHAAAAQITPDGSVGTTVAPNVEIKGVRSEVINGGTIRGGNLFHSFSEFNIETGRGAYFTNPQGITNIFSRITGNHPSNINGILGVLGNANLFLLNPNGILFGPNAKLDLGGSFFGTTANSIRFADGVEFSATNPSTSPLLTVSVPIGLQMGANPGSITVQGSGHNVNVVLPGFKWIFTNRPVGLQVPIGQTLALVGGDIVLDGGNLTAEEGRIELASSRNTLVNFNLSSGLNRLNLESGSVQGGSISLRNSASLNASGESGGAIQIQGRGLTLQDGSYIFADTRGSGQGKGITVQTTEFVDLLGVSGPGQLILPGLHTDASETSTGKSGGITIQTGRLLLDNGDTVSSVSYGNDSRTGDIVIRAKDVELRNGIPIPPFFVSYMANLIVNGTGRSGNISIEAERVRLIDGGTIGADVLVGAGSAGDISIQASERIEIRGTSQINGKTSLISSGVQPRASGQGGNIILQTPILRLSEGGQLTAAVSGSGNAGNIQIKATEVSVSDVVFDGFTESLSGISVAVGSGATGKAGNLTIEADRLSVFNGGQISSANNGSGTAGNISLRVRDLNVRGSGVLRAISGPLATVDPIEGAVLLEDGQILSSGITASSTTNAAAGSIEIAADSVGVREGGEISVSNAGGGNAGNLNLTANRIQLDTGGHLNADVTGGTQGNLTLNAAEIQLRRGSNITTNATGNSTGGNITINTDILVGLENSDIIANAVQGNGGRIDVTTQGIFGLQYRLQQTEDSDITASSQFGLSGTINVSVLNVNQQNVVEPPPSNFVSTDQVVANSCTRRQGNSQGTFTIAGNGGLPETPETGTIPYQVIQVGSAPTGSAPSSVQPSPVTTSWKWGDPIVEATEFSVNAQGQVVLTAKGNSAAGAIAQPQPSLCQPD